ncbi:MAG TPA: hypothetical protein PLB81_05520 [Deltaproteobacteria bacterium]|nr:hypothetical protein [Deltaproteobacteria bacterium]
MAGPSDIAAILSQSGRIEKINQQNPFAHADVSKQIITEQEARERMRFAREVNESKRVQEASDRQRKEHRRSKQNDHGKSDAELGTEKSGDEKEVKHLIDVVI